jgi:uncharacterized membrane protein
MILINGTMEYYALVKCLHVLSATILFGTGVGSAFYMFMANRGRRVADIHWAVRHVVLADWIFTTPAVIFQLFSGFYLMQLSGHQFSERWLGEAFGLYVFAGACWVPVVWMQIKMRDMAAQASSTGRELPARYWAFDRWWIILGSLAFPAVAWIFWLMIAKPV